MVGEEKLIKIKVCIERFVLKLATNELMMRTQMDYIFRKRTGQKCFFSLAVINDKKTYMKTNTRLLIYMDKQRSGPVFLYEVFYQGGTF